MTNIKSERDGLVDGMPRDERGYWQPEGGTAPPNPVFAWPPKPVDVLKWLYHYLFPWNLIYMVIAALTWLFLTPEMSRMVEFRIDWTLEVFVRNQVMLIVIVSAWHIWFWSRKSQGFQYKYTPDWLGVGKRQFLWSNQLRDNIFWSVVSGGTIWTDFEVLMLWAYANEIIPFVDPRQQPLYLSCCSLSSHYGGCFTSIGVIGFCIGRHCTGLRTMSITKISTWVPGQGWQCTQLSMFFTSVVF